MDKIYYKFNPITKDYVRNGKALLDVEESKRVGKDVYILPANATFIEVPTYKAGYIPVFENGNWVVKIDNRGKRAISPDGIIDIKYIGEKEGDIVFTDNQEELYSLGELIYKDNKLTEAPLSFFKDRKIKEIKLIKKTKENEGICFKDKVFDSDERSLQKLNCVLETAKNTDNFNINWICKDNSTILLNVDDIKGLISAFSYRFNEITLKYNELKEKINNSNNKDEINSINWEEENEDSSI